jgi:hypothetical protein
MDLLVASYLVAPLIHGSVAVIVLGTLGLFFLFTVVPLAYACAVFPGIPLLVLMVRKGWLTAMNFVLFGVACGLHAALFGIAAVGTGPLAIVVGLVAISGGIASALVIWAVGVRGNTALTRYSIRAYECAD